MGNFFIGSMARGQLQSHSINKVKPELGVSELLAISPIVASAETSSKMIGLKRRIASHLAEIKNQAVGQVSRRRRGLVAVGSFGNSGQLQQAGDANFADHPADQADQTGFISHA